MKGTPWLISLAAGVIRRLPMGRWVVAEWIARTVRTPFLATLPVADGALTFECDLSDELSREVCFTGRYAAVETAVVRAVLHPGMTFVDVGANWGYFTLVAARAVGEGGCIASFEPDPRMFAMLSANVERNHLTCVHTRLVAAHSSLAELRLSGHAHGADNRGESSVLARSPGDDGPDFLVHGEPLDDLLDALGMGVVDLVKIDVEGAESSVLDGMANGIRVSRYRRILLELHEAQLASNGVSVDDLLGRLLHDGFRAYWLAHDAAAVRRAAYQSRIRTLEYLRPARVGDSPDRWPHLLLLAHDTPVDQAVEPMT